MSQFRASITGTRNSAATPFGGFHDGGWNWGNPRAHTCTAAFADCSVRSLSDAIAPDVLEALATVSGKESLPANW